MPTAARRLLLIGFLLSLFLLLGIISATYAQDVVTETTTTTTTKTVTRRSFVFPDDNYHYRHGVMRLRLGAFVPMRSDVRTATNNTHLSGGVSFDLLHADVRRQPLVTELYTDVTDRADGGSRLTNAGAGLAFRFYTGAPNAESRGYFGLGGGAYRVRFATPGSGTDTHFKAGGKAFVGVDTPGGLFFEVNYTALEKERGYDTGGGMIQLGFRL